MPRRTARGLKSSAAIAFALLLTGCAVQTFPTMGVLREGLAGMVGAPVDALVQQIGYPESDVTIGGRKVYTWDHRKAFTYFVPETICRDEITFYPRGRKEVVRVCETHQVEKTVLHHCTIKVETDEAENIIGFSFDGNADGCERFAVAFRNLPYEACIEKLSGLKFAVNIGTEPQEKLSAAIERCKRLHRQDSNR